MPGPMLLLRGGALHVHYMVAPLRHASPVREGLPAVRILIVDDDPASRRYASMALEESGIEYEAVDCPTKAHGALADGDSGRYDAVLLDVDLPGAKGWSLLTDLRAEGISIPVIFVSMHESLADRVHGLNLGADDYIVKPFEFSELVARLRAVLRRCARSQAGRIASEILDPDEGRIEPDGRSAGA
jgi:two-component system, OmpR family, copper resistance phosphate regulon response regulator CusR